MSDNVETEQMDLRVVMFDDETFLVGSCPPVEKKCPLEKKKTKALRSEKKPKPRLELGTFALQVRRINHFAIPAVHTTFAPQYMSLYTLC